MYLPPGPRSLSRGGRLAPIIAYETLGESAMMSVPAPDHYLPLLYVISPLPWRRTRELSSRGFDGGSISMLAIQVG